MLFKEWEGDSRKLHGINEPEEYGRNDHEGRALRTKRRINIKSERVLYQRNTAKRSDKEKDGINERCDLRVCKGSPEDLCSLKSK